MVLARLGAFSATLAALALAPAAAFADKPKEWEWNFQEPATPVMEAVIQLHDKLLWIISFISVFVLGLLVVAMFRFNEKRNPIPSRTTHNTTIEVLWTVIPVLVLLFIAFGPPMSSFRLLYFADRAPDASMTLKAIGHQWYWSYVYPDNGNFTFDARMVTAEAAVAKEKNVIRLLDTDEEVVLPVGKNIRIQITSEDVIHSWTIPSFGVKHDAVPGRINESWFNIEKPGIYYGQCSELCGIQHAYMPIKVHAVTQEEFDAWVKDAQGKFDKAADAAPDSTPTTPATSQVAQAQPAN